MENIKVAHPDHDILDIFAQRWSVRSFADMPIAASDLDRIFEAARWAPSSINEQPWEYHYAHKGSAGFQDICDCLAVGNKPWAQHAAVLIVAAARTTMSANQKPNAWSTHDLGLANAQLLLQARAMEIYSHPMGGFDKNLVIEKFQFPDTLEPVCIIALGYLDSPEKLEEPFRTREITPRVRKKITEFTKKYD